MEAALRLSGDILIGPRANGITWRMNDLVVILGENGNPMGRGRDMWILSHLTYLTVWVFETFQIFKVGREGDGDSFVLKEGFKG